MRKLFTLLLLSLLSSMSIGQTLNNGSTQASAVLEDQMPPGKMYMNIKTATKPWYGASTFLVANTCNLNTDRTCDPRARSCNGSGVYLDKDVFSTLSALPTEVDGDMYQVSDTGKYYAGISGTWTLCSSIAVATNGSNTPIWGQPYSHSSVAVGAGSFRVNCSISHFGYDDPIVKPGDPGQTHMHFFVGNALTNARTSLDDMSLLGNSTCHGGRANASGYWMPVPFYHCPKIAIGCDHKRDGQIVKFQKEANVYYKCNGYGGGDCDHTSMGLVGGVMTAGQNPVQWAPIGLRVIVGHATATTSTFDGGGSLRFACFHSDGTSESFHNQFPTPQEAASTTYTGVSDPSKTCDEINMMSTEPDCWDGVHVDSPDHFSHLAFSGGGTNGSNGSGCRDPAYPIQIATPGMNQHFDLYGGIADWAYIRLSSDPACYNDTNPPAPRNPAAPVGGFRDSLGNPILCNGIPDNGQPAGWTLHMDWVNGWSHNPNFMGWGKGSVTDLILKNCWGVGLPASQNKGGIDCHDDNLGNVNGDGINWALQNITNSGAIKGAAP